MPRELEVGGGVSHIPSMLLIVPSRALHRLVWISSAAAAFVFVGCGKTREGAPPPAPDSAAVVPAPDSAQSAPADSVPPDSVAGVAFEPRFQRFAVRTPRRLNALLDSIGPANAFEVLKVNRVDLAHVRDRDTLVVPDVFGDSLDLAPFPREITAVRDTAKLLLISLRSQAFAAYDSGLLVRWGPTSTGRRDMPTPIGLYHTNWKDKDRISTFSDEWKLEWYVNLDNFQGVSLHEYELPGRPASHSCVRLLEPDAIWMYGWAEQWRLGPDPREIVREGTPAVIFGAWTWDQRAPWKRLPEDPHATTITAAEIDDALRILAERKKPVYPKKKPQVMSVPSDSMSRRAAPDDSSGRH